jgi:hypothetical protein
MNRAMDGFFQRAAKAALLATFCGGCLSAKAAQVRTGVVNDSGVYATPVTIRSPADGAVVAGEIAVYAEAAEHAGLAGVQFLLDGARLEAEDTSPPYSIGWDTATSPNGLHTLTAVARHMDGRPSYSTAVTVITGNESSLRAEMTRVEETDFTFVWSDSWIADGAYGPWSGGSAQQSVDAGSYVIFTFQGAGFRWIGYRGSHGGIVKLYIDGALIAELDTYRPQEEISVPVYSVTGLESGIHSVLLELTGLKHEVAIRGGTVVDAFDVMP